MKEFAKKALNFFGLCAWVLGTIGGFGYAAYNKAWLIAVCVAVLGVFSWKTVKGFVDELLK